MRLVLAEDHTLLRAGMTQLLEANGFTVVHSVMDEPGLRDALRDPAAERPSSTYASHRGRPTRGCGRRSRRVRLDRGSR